MASSTIGSDAPGPCAYRPATDWLMRFLASTASPESPLSLARSRAAIPASHAAPTPAETPRPTCPRLSAQSAAKSARASSGSHESAPPDEPGGPNGCAVLFAAPSTSRRLLHDGSRARVEAVFSDFVQLSAPHVSIFEMEQVQDGELGAHFFDDVDDANSVLDSDAEEEMAPLKERRGGGKMAASKKAKGAAADGRRPPTAPRCADGLALLLLGGSKASAGSKRKPSGGKAGAKRAKK